MGHGFWQISPELMYRIFAPENGFQAVAVMMRELPHLQGVGHINTLFYIAHDPQQLGWRVELMNSRRTYLITIAQRVAELPIFEKWPQQSDYQRLWEQSQLPAPSRAELGNRLLKRLRRIIPMNLERAVRPPFYNKAYTKVDRSDLIHGQFRSLAPVRTSRF
jgi:hypothetical protein